MTEGMAPRDDDDNDDDDDDDENAVGFGSVVSPEPAKKVPLTMRTHLAQ